jgi:hypothetical protein
MFLKDHSRLLAPERFTRALMPWHADAWQVHGGVTLEPRATEHTYNDTKLQTVVAGGWTLILRDPTGSDGGQEARCEHLAASDAKIFIWSNS